MCAHKIMKKDTSPFTIANELFTRGVEVNNPFFVNKILSFQPATILLTIEVNKRLSRLPLWAVNAIYNSGIIKKKSGPYIYYPKFTKVKKGHKQLRRKISSLFHTGDRHSDEIIELLKKMGKQIDDYFGMKL